MRGARVRIVPYVGGCDVREDFQILAVANPSGTDEIGESRAAQCGSPVQTPGGGGRDAGFRGGRLQGVDPLTRAGRRKSKSDTPSPHDHSSGDANFFERNSHMVSAELASQIGFPDKFNFFRWFS